MYVHVAVPPVRVLCDHSMHAHAYTYNVHRVMRNVFSGTQGTKLLLNSTELPVTTFLYLQESTKMYSRCHCISEIYSVLQ